MSYNHGCQVTQIRHIKGHQDISSQGGKCGAKLRKSGIERAPMKCQARAESVVSGYANRSQRGLRGNLKPKNEHQVTRLPKQRAIQGTSLLLDFGIEGGNNVRDSHHIVCIR